ncbi:MAG: response regulator transcription factor [Saprospiraceae bacterium]|nr:response regulator transcription factor [Saprospiraceae bacterium]
MESQPIPIRIAIADDHKILRNGLISSLSKFSDLRIDIEANNGEELLTKMRKHQVDVVLLDIKMPKIDGIEVVKHIRYNDEKLIIIILTMHDEDSYIIKLINAKANAYLVKKLRP